MADAPEAPRRAISEALAAASAVVNEWLDAAHPMLALQLIDDLTVKSTVERFRRGARTKVHWWDWQKKFHKKVKWKNAWLFALQRGEQPVALCLGSISVRAGHVAIEYLERRVYARGVKGVPLVAAYQFATAVANALGISEVRINDPLNPALARHYEQALGMTPVRQGRANEVKYLFKKVVP